MLNRYFPIVHFGIMNDVISRAKSNNPSLDLQALRAALLNEIKDTAFFLEQADAFVHSKQLFIRNWDRGFINAITVLSEWSYYLSGNERRLMIMKPVFLLDRAIKTLLRPVFRLVRHLSNYRRSVGKVVRYNNLRKLK